MPNLSKTVEEYIWYAQNVKNRSPKTLKKYRRYLGNFVKYCDSKQLYDLNQITNFDIDMHISDEQKRITQFGTTHSPVSINTGTISCIRAFFNWVQKVKQQTTRVIPCEIEDLKAPAKHPSVITFSDVKKVVENTKVRQDQLIIATIFESGLRIEELCNMQIEHLIGRKLDVVGKGDKHRITFISYELADELREYWAEKKWQSGAAFRPIMHGDERGYIDSSAPRERIKRCFKTILGMKMKPHWLRHAFALNLLENDCGLRTIQKLLGHSKIETTMRYLGVTDKYLEREYDANFGGSVISK